MCNSRSFGKITTADLFLANISSCNFLNAFPFSPSSFSSAFVNATLAPFGHSSKNTSNTSHVTFSPRVGNQNPATTNSPPSLYALANVSSANPLARESNPFARTRMELCLFFARSGSSNAMDVWNAGMAFAAPFLPGTLVHF